MSPTTNSTATAATNQSSTAKLTSPSLASEETFLKLLVSQIKNQNPTSPMDSTQFVTQLAQYSSLEQLIGIKQDADTVSKALTPTTPPTAAA